MVSLRFIYNNLFVSLYMNTTIVTVVWNGAIAANLKIAKPRKVKSWYKQSQKQ
jgi:hypothetical protein